MIRSTREAARHLFGTAMEQSGYFTAKQAKEAGYDCPHLDYHVSTGAFQRIDHGLYRPTTISPGENDDLVRLSLWSRNRGDEPQAVVSHQSAFVLHDLTELLPSEIHLTVPPPLSGSVLPEAAYSIRRSGGNNCQIRLKVAFPLAQ